MNGGKLLHTLRVSVKERFTSTWTLLASTTSYLARTDIFIQYEQQLKQLLSRLQRSSRQSDEIENIRREIVVLRKTLRRGGHDLTLGAYFISFQGFRNDSCLADGFSRLVLHITKDQIYFIYGQENHISLAEHLEKRTGRIKEKREFIMGSYLWYKWHGKTLILSGSDTETKENFARLQAYGEVNMLFMLKWLKRLP